MATPPTMTARPATPLHVRTWPGSGSPPTLVLLHGFTQNSDCWGPLANALAAAHPLSAIDAPGHGRSNHDDADLWRAAELTADTISASVKAPPVVIGYSMGGRVALHLALIRPNAIAGLVLIGATAGIDDDGDRAARRAADEALAARIEVEPLPDFIDTWLTNPLFTGLTPEAAGRDARLANRSAGLAASLRHCGTGTQEPLWDRLDEVKVPVLLVAGRADVKFRSLAERLAAAMTDTEADLAVIDGTHAVHLERPETAATTINDWVDRRIPGG